MSKNLFESINNLDRLTITEDSYEESVDKISNLMSMCYNEYKNSDYTPSKEDLEVYDDLSDDEYKDAIEELNKLNKLPRYNDMLELSDRRTLNTLGDKVEAKFGDLSDADTQLATDIYDKHLTTALDSFKENTGVECYTEGRMGRHICVEDTYENAIRFEELQNVQKEMEDTLIDEVITELGNEIDTSDTNESEDITEDFTANQATNPEEIQGFEGADENKIVEDAIDPEAQTALWDLVDNATYGDAMVDAVCKEYGISKELADKVIEDYIKYLKFRKEEAKSMDESETLKEQVIPENVEEQIRSIIEEIKDVESTIRHSVEDTLISINARIEEINKENDLLLDRVETDGLYSNMSEVVRDLDYALKNSEWSKEEQNEIENESEELTESSEDKVYLIYSDCTILITSDINDPDEGGSEKFESVDEMIQYFRDHKNEYEGMDVYEECGSESGETSYELSDINNI